MESSIPQKEVMSHKATKLQVLIKYIKDNGGSYSCLECKKEMCPDVEPIGLNKNLRNVMRISKKSLVELMENNSKNINIKMKTVIALDLKMIRKPCKPVFNELGDGEFSYRVTSCNECSYKKGYIDIEDILYSSEISSDDSDFSEEDEDDDDSASYLSQSLSRPLSPPLPEYVGPYTQILTIKSESIECPKNISGSVKRKRTMEEDTAIVGDNENITNI